jgi:iron(III) transport system ATP-binding protein
MQTIRPQAEAGPAALVLEGVSHAFGDVLAVNAVTLRVEAGELVCLLGPSGCGKTTVLRVAAGLEHRQAGIIRLGERVLADDRTEVPPEARSIGLVFQDYALFPHLSVIDNVAFGLRGLDSGTQRGRARETLAQVAMEGYAEAFPHTLSGGQQQRVALARALAPRPQVMLLDEPFSGLDTRLRDQVRDQTLHVLKASGTATLIVTHDPDEAMFMADRIALMRDGRIVQEGTPTELYFRPDSPFVAAFFSDVNRLSGVVLDGRVATPLGDVAGSTLANGTRVDVLIRPEALMLEARGADAEAGGPAARVMAARLLGRTSLIHLSVPQAEGGHLHLHARVPGKFLPSEAKLVTIRLDRSQAFVFPAECPT